MLSQAAVLLALSVPSMLLLVAVAVVLVGLIAWLLPRPDASLSVRRLGGDEPHDRRSPG
jgi:hypothetical protein